jgi:hypothetical protein
MSWSAPITAVANTAFTAADFNTNVRDNLLCTAPAIATTPGSYFCVADQNVLSERQVNSAFTATSETISSSAWGDLATVGPQVTVTTGVMALAFYTAWCVNNTLNQQAAANIQVTGASNVNPLDTPAYWENGKPANKGEQSMGVYLYTTLNPGSNTFTMKYRAYTSGTGTFSNRQLVILPL